MNNEPFDNPNQPLFENPINLRQYWQIILERRWLVITAFLSVFILALIYLFRATPIYQATTTIQINRELDNVLQMGNFSFETREQDYLQTQYRNLLSRSLLESVIEDLDLLNKDERYANALDPVSALANSIDITPIRLSRLVEIKVQHPDKKLAADIANAMATKFIGRNLDQKKNATLEVVELLEKEIEGQKQAVEKAALDLHEYRKTHNIVSFESPENLAFQTLLQFRSEHDRAVAEAKAAETVIEEIDALLGSGGDIYTIPQVRENPEIQALQKELEFLRAEFAEMRERYLEGHNHYVRTQERIAALESGIKRQADTIVASLRTKAMIAKATERNLLALRGAAEKEAEYMKELQIEYEVLRREAESSELLYRTVLASVKERDLAANNMVNNMFVRDLAPTPLKPIKPRIMLTLFLGVFGGLAAAIGLAFFVNFLDDSVKTQEDVEDYLRLPFLGYVPNIKTNSVVERDLQSHLHPQSNAAEGFRTVRATVSLTHKPDKFRILTVTSTIPSEGKSLIASNLAIVTAQTGLRTLLVDADLRRPSVHKAFQLHSPQGLSSYLLEETDQVDGLIHKTEVPNLDVICSGAIPSTPSELIGSQRMLNFLDTLRSRYDRVILDCPPVSAVSDPLILSSMSDGVIYVTKFNKIRREHARKAIQRMQNAGIHIIGVVLNDIDFEGRDSYYYSYYYYQNSYYASHYKPVSQERAKPAPVEVAKARNGD